MRTMLVVDDEIDCCDAFKNYFTKRGWEVHVAYDGREAEGLLKGMQYEYIFFDCNMPELSGVELVEVIKQYNPSAKKIMVSGYNLVNEDFAKNLGVDQFLVKPVSLEEAERITQNG